MMDNPGDEAKKVGEALAWVAGVLERHGVPYQIVWGLAARAHGAARPVVDVDLYVPFDRGSTGRGRRLKRSGPTSCGAPSTSRATSGT
jgi:hypothetical protein